jgi:hypothetical protein
VLSQPAHESFIRFIKDHNKEYKSDTEFMERFGIFKSNLQIIHEKNLESNGGALFAVNKFADLSPEEFAELYLMKDLPPYAPNATFLEVPTPAAPLATFNWEDKGATTAIKDQKQCGSCWAFSVTENVESVHFIASSSLPILAPQQLVDCNKANYGCSGGWPYVAMQYLTQCGGQDTEASYPYRAIDQTCAFKPASIAAKINGYKQLPKSYTSIMNALPTTSPFSICVDASSWQFYSSGVMTPSQCGTDVDHCVQLVGYNSDSSPNYWIIRNSWGTGWGQQGHIWVQMGPEDACLVLDYCITAISA